MAKTLGLHVTAERIDVVAVSGNAGRAQATGAFSAPWPKAFAAANAAELGVWLKKQLAEHALASGEVAVALGRGLASCRTVLVPDAPADELPGLVRFAAESQTDASDILDFHAGSLRQGQREIAVGSVPQAALAALQAILKAAGLRLAVAEPRAYTVRWLREKLGDGDPLRPELLVAPAPGGGEASVWQGGRLELARPLPAGDGDQTARLTAELRRTLVAHEALEGMKVAAAVALADGAGPWAAAARGLGGVTVSAADPAAKVPGAAEHEADLAALGAAWRLAAGSAAPIDFAHPKKPVVNTGAKARLGALAAAFAGLLLLAGYFQAQRGLRSLDADADDLRGKINVLKDLLVAEPVRKKYETVKAWMNSRVDWLHVFADVSRRLPDTQDAIVTALSGTTGANTSDVKFTLQTSTMNRMESALDDLEEEFLVLPNDSKSIEGNPVFKASMNVTVELPTANDAKAGAANGSKATAPALPSKKHDEGLAKAGKRRVPTSFGQQVAAASVTAPAPGLATSGRPGRTAGRPSSGASVGAPPPAGISASAADTAGPGPAADSPEAALATKVKKLAAMSYEDRERDIAKERPIFQRALRKRVEEQLEKDKK